MLHSGLLIFSACLLLITILLLGGRSAQATSPGVAYLSSADGQRFALYVASADGSQQRQLTPNTLPAQQVAWSPDGAWLVFSAPGADRRTHLHRIRPNGRIAQQLTFLDGHQVEPQWSPDGQWLAFEHYQQGPDGDIYRLSADGKYLQRLTQKSGQGFFPHWSSDGEWIAFASYVGGDSFQLYRMRADGTGRESLSFAYHSSLNWSPDNRFLVFTVRVNYSGDFEIYRTDIAQKDTIRLTGGTGISVMPQWSPDGDSIVFASSRTGRMHIYQMDADGNQQTALTSGNRDYSLPQWSPDGQWLAMVEADDNTREIVRMHPDGSALQAITTDGGYNSHPRWSPIVDVAWRAPLLLLASGLGFAVYWGIGRSLT